MHSAFLTINQVPTRVTTWGKWVEESFQDNDPKDLVLFIPGNPGASKFYFHFLQTLHEQLGWPVWVIGHAGHERPENEMLHKIPVLKENPHLYDLNGQVQQKIEFVEKYVPKNVRIHLIGHSVGTYVITKLLKIPTFRAQVVKSYLLMPTVEYIADTPNGKWYTNLVHHIVFLILFLAWFFTLLPKAIQHFLILIYCLVTGSNKKHIPTICELLEPAVLESVFFMASDEMVNLKERETAVIKDNTDRIKVYFSRIDGWAPVSYFTKLKDDIPEIEGEICNRNFSHAFCLRNGKDMALILANWIKES